MVPTEPVQQWLQLAVMQVAIQLPVAAAAPVAMVAVVAAVEEGFG